MRKSSELIPLIINATDREGAIRVLNETLDVLGLNTDFTTLKKSRELLDEFRKEYIEVESRYRSYSIPRNFDLIHEVRNELSYLYTRLTDSLSFDINRLKVFYDEHKTVVRANAMLELSIDEAFQSKIKASSPSALRDVYGASKQMQSYTFNYSYAYGLWKDLEGLLQSISNLSNAIASEERNVLKINEY